jgi:hypothetical protein
MRGLAIALCVFFLFSYLSIFLPFLPFFFGPFYFFLYFFTTLYFIILLFYFIYFILFILFYFILFYFILFYFILFYFILFYFILFIFLISYSDELDKSLRVMSMGIAFSVGFQVCVHSPYSNPCSPSSFTSFLLKILNLFYLYPLLVFALLTSHFTFLPFSLTLHFGRFSHSSSFLRLCYLHATENHFDFMKTLN